MVGDDLVGLPAQGDGGRGAPAGVLRRIGQGLLRRALDRQTGFRRQRPRFADNRVGDEHSSGSSGLLDEARQLFRADV
jgi:hypothetical protein